MTRGTLLTVGVAALIAALSTVPAQAQERSTEEMLDELLRARQELQRSLDEIHRQVDDIDSRIDELVGEDGAAEPPAPAQTSPSPSAPIQTRPEPLAQAEPRRPVELPEQVEPSPPAEDQIEAEPEGTEPGVYEPGRGIILASGRLGEASLGIRGYFRYLNQMGLNESYTDSFGRQFALDKRQDFQLNRLQLLTRGWLFDPRLRWSFYAWTQNVSLGDESQVVVGGNMTAALHRALNVQLGIFSIPSTRSTNQSFPNWLRIDHRTMADEFFRGSYSEGILAFGTLAKGLEYSASLTNNLSILGVSADELDNGLNTYSLALRWMPTTGEFGPGEGFGDWEHHEDLATLLGVRFTHSREDAQAQSGPNDFENTQLRLSDGTIIFAPDPFGTGGTIDKATYQMLNLDAGLKYQGWSLDAEYYFRWIDDFDVITQPWPVTELYDHGFQLQGSTMLIPHKLQAYLSGSTIFGEYGEPWDVAAGMTYFPFGRKEVRMNAQALYMEQSAVGYTAVPYQVGGDGWVFTVDVGYWF